MNARSRPVGSEQPTDREDFHEVEYLLRRADQEVVAAIRANDPRVRASHHGLANRYGRASLALIAKLDAETESGRLIGTHLAL